jgi:hypothetical protein
MLEVIGSIAESTQEFVEGRKKTKRTLGSRATLKEILINADYLA